jgi:hypothetical protein
LYCKSSAFTGRGRDCALPQAALLLLAVMEITSFRRNSTSKKNLATTSNIVNFIFKRVNIYGNFSCLDVRKFASRRAKISIKWEENLHQDARKFLSRGKKIFVKTHENFYQVEKNPR